MESKAQKNSSSSSSDSKLQLYSYWQSSCSWRVRFALNLKGLQYEYKAVNIAKGEQYTPEFERLNPLHFVPVLVDGDVVIADSYAILMYLEEKYPSKQLLPIDPRLRALNLQASSIVSSSIQPLHMLSILKLIEEKMGSDERIKWAQSNIEKGFAALERLLRDHAGMHATGDDVYMADVFLAPQISVAEKRFNVDMGEHLGEEENIISILSDFLVNKALDNDFSSELLRSFVQSKFPTLRKIYEKCCELPEFQASLPDRQPDAVVL